MAEYNSQQPNTDALLDLVTGKTLADLVEVRDEVITSIDDAKEVSSKLTSGNDDMIVGALRTILSGANATIEYPHLPQYKARAESTHKHMPLVITALQADVPVWLHGEAGSGKSTSGRKASEALGLDFRSISLGPSTSKSDVLGYRDAVGIYHDTGFRRMYEDGGVFLFDEIDNGHPSILTILNSALANGHGEFPDGMVARSNATRFIATANTIGKGATGQYVGRAPIDAATLDRFAFVPMDIDPGLEESIVLEGHESPRDEIELGEGEIPTDRQWLAIVRANREAANELGLRTIISSRAAIYGVRLAKLGIGRLWLEEMLIYKGMKQNDREKLDQKASHLLNTQSDSLGKKLYSRTDERRTKNEVGTHVAEPKSVRIPERYELTQNNCADLEDYFNFACKQLRNSQETKYRDFVFDTCWQLEKHAGLTVGCTDKDTIGLRRLTRYADDYSLHTIHEVVSGILRRDDKYFEHAKSDFTELKHINISSYRTLLINNAAEYNINISNGSSNGIIGLIVNFEAMYGFTPGPYSLLWSLSQSQH